MKQSGTPSQPAQTRNPFWLGLERREAAVLLLYIAMVAVAVLYYQQSQDEGREWIITRSFAIPPLVFHVLHYEGHPPLLYLLLWLPVHLHMPYAWLNWVSALAGVSSIYLLLRLSPFPFYLRAVLPFCFALGYQEAVVARSYVLFPLLGFLAAHLYRSRPSKPLAVAVTLALLANVSFHGTLVSIGFAIAYLLQLRPERKTTVRAGFSPQKLPPQALWQAGVLFIASLVSVAVCILPAKYSGMPPAQAIARMLHRVKGPQAEPPQARSALPLGAQPSAITVTSNDASPTIPAKGFLQRYATQLWLTFVYPISNVPAFSYAFELLIILFLVLQRQWALVLPIALLDYFLLFGFVDYRHTPLAWITILLVLWAAWDKTPHPNRPRLQTAVAGALALLCTLQIPWTLQAIQYERHHATYPARMTATYLNTLPSATTIDGDMTAYAILPYRSTYVPIDRADGRFVDHGSYATSATIDILTSRASDILLLNELMDEPEARSKLSTSGYTETQTFCGGPYFPNAPIGTTCFHIFARR